MMSKNGKWIGKNSDNKLTQQFTAETSDYKLHDKENSDSINMETKLVNNENNNKTLNLKNVLSSDSNGNNIEKAINSISRSDLSISNSDAKLLTLKEVKVASMMKKDKKLTDYAFLKKIFVLNFQKKELTALNFDFDVNKISHIKVLNISHNMINDFSFVVYFPNLTSLNVSYNDLSSVYDYVFYPKLIELNLSFTNMQYIRHLEAPNLEELYINNCINQIEIDENSIDLPELVKFESTNTKFKNFNFFCKLPYLVKLNIENTGVKDLYELAVILINKPRLNTLNYMHNLVCKNPRAFDLALFMCPQLKKLNNKEIKPMNFEIIRRRFNDINQIINS